MSTYYFHVRRGGVIYEDRDGFELDGIKNAVLHARNDARAVMRDEPEVAADDQWIEVVDEKGNTVRTVPFVTVAIGRA